MRKTTGYVLMTVACAGAAIYQMMHDQSMWAVFLILLAVWIALVPVMVYHTQKLDGRAYR